MGRGNPGSTPGGGTTFEVTMANIDDVWAEYEKTDTKKMFDALYDALDRGEDIDFDAVRKAVVADFVTTHVLNEE